MHLCRHRGGPRPWLVWVHGAGQGGTEDLLLSRIGPNTSQVGVQRRDAGAARPRLPAPRMAGLPGHGSAGQCRGHDARGVGGARRRADGHSRKPARLWCRGFRWAPRWPRWCRTWSGRLTRLRCTPRSWDSTRMIARHLGRWGSSRDGFRELLGSPVVSKLTSVIDPLAVDPAPPPHRRLIVGAWHDRMAMREPAIALQERWGGQLYWYDGSHVGHMFSRRVQRVTERFLRGVAVGKDSNGSGPMTATRTRTRGGRALQPRRVERAQLRRSPRSCSPTPSSGTRSGRRTPLTHEEAVNRIIGSLGQCSDKLQLRPEPRRRR